MGVCKHCGAILNSNEELCNSCKRKQMTINKMYDFYNKMLPAEKHFYNIRKLEKDIMVAQQAEYSSLSMWVIFALVSFVCLMYGAALIDTIFAFVIILIPIFWCITFKKIGQYRRVFYENKEKGLSELKQKLQKEYNTISAIYESTNKFVPTNYAEPSVVRILIQLLNDQRADSLKETINLYENIKHTDEMMRLQQEINHSSKISAIANTVSAFANVDTAINTRR